MVTTLEGALEVLRSVGDDSAEPLQRALDYPDMETGFLDHRTQLTLGPSPHQDPRVRVTLEANELLWKTRHALAKRVGANHS